MPATEQAIPQEIRYTNATDPTPNNETALRNLGGGF